MSNRPLVGNGALAASTLFLIPLLLFAAAPTAAQVPLGSLSAMTARSIGPSGQGGRVTAIDAVVSDPDIVYVGTAAGGVWRSENAGTTWTPIFDDQPVQSIGAIAIDPNNADVIWVGTGEGSPRNSANQGNGIYRSVDGGESWTHLGLENSRVIHRIVVHPADPNVAYLGVTGSPFGDSEERGVYRTRDRGETWERVLFVDARTGVGDLVLDPRNPDKLFAAMWSHRREPDFMTSGGPGSGLYVTYDGGDTWTERTSEDGLPAGELGRIGVAVADSDPRIVYAIVEAEKNVLLRSEDGGRSFETVNSDSGVSPRPFYYSEIYVDPANENRLYRLSSPVDVSEDGGRTFETLVSGEFVHVDHHAWWIHPTDPTLIYDGNDGGAAVSRDRGRTWQVFHNLPIGQFYHVNVDMETPYNVYGGLQDNDSFRGPAYHWVQQGIQNYVWENLSCCADGFDIAPDPRDGRFGYSMYQGGTLLRYDRVTGQLRMVSPTIESDTPLRFNWNAALALDPTTPGRVYFASQFLHQSDDDGRTWRTISPDLTTNDPARQRQYETGGLTFDDSGAENNTTIVSIGPSPVQTGVVWVGSDDGLVHVTTDGGASWTEVSGDMPDFPEGAWVPQIRAGYHAAGEAFVVVEDHRRDDWTPYLYHTRDFGESWTRLAEEVDGYGLSFEQDPFEPNLMFFGTDRGLWVSVDGGDEWQRWTHGVPATPVRDMVVHPREGDLVMGTFGRSFLVIDDLSPLRRIAAEGVDAVSTFALHPVPDAYDAQLHWPPGAIFPGHHSYQGENRPFGARIAYSLPWSEDDVDEDGEDEVTIEILDGTTVIRRFTGPAEPGLNRTTWGLRRRGVRPPQRPVPTDPDAAEPAGRTVMPGTYTVRVSHGADTATTSVEVHPDPRTRFSATEARMADALWEELTGVQESVTGIADRIREAREAIERIGEAIEAGDYAEADSLTAHGTRTDEALEAFYHRIVPEPVQGFRNEPDALTSLLGDAGFRLSTGRWATPTEGARHAVDRAIRATEALEAEVEAFFAAGGAWETYRAAVQAVGVSLFR